MQSLCGTRRAFILASLTTVLAALVSPLRVWAVAGYSGASAGSDGTVYGWGVTDVTTYSYIHTAYVTTTLRSPNGRTATRAWLSARNSIRADVSLAWDSTDLGTYTTTSTHKAYCTQMGWFINGATSNANCNVCPEPVNFRETGWGEPFDGVLQFSYAWDSSIGDRAELTNCEVGEYVTFPTSTDPWVWPRPPWYEESPNPTIDWVPGTDAVFTDDHLTGTFLSPYKEATFTTTQKYRYRCKCKNNNTPVDIYGPHTITRSVTKKTDGKYKYTITKKAGTASIDPLP